MLHYTWQHRLFPLGQLMTTDGRKVEVISPGMHNTNAGPDFQNARLKIDDIMWIGSVEIHLHSSDWYRHHHETDKAYDDVVLHVVEDADREVETISGYQIPQLVLAIPDYVKDNFAQLMKNDIPPYCRRILPSLSNLTIHSWMSSLFIERLQSKTETIMTRWESYDRNWEDTLFATVARNFGFGINGNQFETWIRSIPMNAVGKHRDDLFQIEAIFFGQAGLLDDELIPEHYRKAAKKDEYLQHLRSEYKFMKTKFSLTPMPSHIWNFLRLRPQNFPHIRIAQLAMLYYEQHLSLSHILNAKNICEIKNIVDTHVSKYWQTHYTFASTESKALEKHLSTSSIDLILINSIIPIMFTYGKYKSDDNMCEHATNLMEYLHPENNSIIRNWKESGVLCQSAADSQALIQLTTKYCRAHDCLHCRFGYEYIKNTLTYLQEDN